jgi:hypothetical protein
MRLLRIAIFLAALGAGMPAATITVTTQPSVVLKSGYSLEFLFTDTGYAQYASGMGLSPDPAQVFFNLASFPGASAGQFTVELKSGNGSHSAAFPDPVDWTSGVVATSGYNGPASVLEDCLNLSSALSQAIFVGSTAELRLTYTGPDVTVGLPDTTLEHDLTITLAGGPLTVGAMDYTVLLNQVPEPGSASLILAVGASLCAISLALKRFRGPR